MTARIAEITVRGEVPDHLTAGLEAVEVAVQDGVTWVRAVVRDAAELYGLLGQVDASGLELLAVHLSDPPPRPDPLPT